MKNHSRQSIFNVFFRASLKRMSIGFMLFTLSRTIFSNLAFADIIESDENHFKLLFKVEIKASIEKLDKTFSKVSTWWHPDHTYTGDAKNLYFDFKKSHCFCESLNDGGFVSHMKIGYAEPRKMYRLLGGLGPLQSIPVNGVLEFRMSKTSETESLLEVSYIVAGGSNMLKGWDKPVNQVIGEQVKRLASEAEK